MARGRMVRALEVATMFFALRISSGPQRQMFAHLGRCSRGGPVAECALFGCLVAIGFVTVEATTGTGLRQLFSAVLRLL
jgi:hypothetical protein